MEYDEAETRELAGRFFREAEEPALRRSGMPADARKLLRDTYVQDVLANPRAVHQLRALYQGAEPLPPLPRTVPGMFTVTGVIRRTGEPYDVRIGVEPGGAAWGVAAGSPAAVALLMGLAGERVSATPTGPSAVVSDADPAAMYYALLQYTDVSATTGDVPVIPAIPDGAVG